MLKKFSFSLLHYTVVCDLRQARVSLLWEHFRRGIARMWTSEHREKDCYMLPSRHKIATATLTHRSCSCTKPAQYWAWTVRQGQRRGYWKPVLTLLNDWLLIHSVKKRVVVCSCVLTGNSIKLQCTVKNIIQTDLVKLVHHKTKQKDVNMGKRLAERREIDIVGKKIREDGKWAIKCTEYMCENFKEIKSKIQFLRRAQVT